LPVTDYCRTELIRIDQFHWSVFWWCSTWTILQPACQLHAGENTRLCYDELTLNTLLHYQKLFKNKILTSQLKHEDFKTVANIYQLYKKNSFTHSSVIYTGQIFYLRHMEHIKH